MKSSEFLASSSTQTQWSSLTRSVKKISTWGKQISTDTKNQLSDHIATENQEQEGTQNICLRLSHLLILWVPSPHALLCTNHWLRQVPYQWKSKRILKIQDICLSNKYRTLRFCSKILLLYCMLLRIQVHKIVKATLYHRISILLIFMVLIYCNFNQE